MNTTQKISQDFQAVAGATNIPSGDRILRMTDAATPYWWNATKGRRATNAEGAKAAGCGCARRSDLHVAACPLN